LKELFCKKEIVETVVIEERSLKAIVKFEFLPRDALNIMAYAMMRCPFVRPSVCHVRVLYQNK